MKVPPLLISTIPVKSPLKLVQFRPHPTAARRPPQVHILHGRGHEVPPSSRRASGEQAASSKTSALCLIPSRKHGQSPFSSPLNPFSPARCKEARSFFSFLLSPSSSPTACFLLHFTSRQAPELPRQESLLLPDPACSCRGVKLSLPVASLITSSWRLGVTSGVQCHRESEVLDEA